MSEPTRQEKCADLARAMGWRQGESSGVWFSPANAPEICVYDEPPNPYESAEDKDKLVAWLAADDARWKEFDDRLLMALSLQPLVGFDSTNVGFLRMVRRMAMTAPLPVIADAAWLAITSAHSTDT